jgi:anti-sigma factor RsiW
MSDPAPRMTLEEWLRAAYADPEAGCPPPEGFLEAEAGALSPEERRRIEGHADRCPACAAERDLARRFDGGPQAAGTDSADVASIVSRLAAASPVRPPAGRVVSFPTAKKPAPARTAVWRLAAAAVLVLGGGLLFQLTRQTAPPLPNPPPSGGVVRGGEVEALAPIGDVAAPPAELRWRPRPGAVSYRVTLSAVDGTVLWQSTVTAPSARLPEEVVQELHRAVVYFWRVEALDAAGARLGASEPVRFRARPAPEGGSAK